MLDWTDRHDRFFLRLLSRHTLLYTEMVPAQALVYGDPAQSLAHSPAEHPLALQLAGSDPELLDRAVRIAAPHGFCEINLNVGCPSERVSKGRFGACLMAEPELVAECVSAMQAAAGPIPVTVKHRIGIDHLDSWEHLTGFVATLERAGVRTLIVHARKAWLKGLSPKENRSVPPLRHDVVHRLKREFPGLEIILNGGITDLAQAREHLCAPWGDEGLPAVDGIMIGRAAYETPGILAGADRQIFGSNARPDPSPHAVVRALVPYAQAMVEAGEPVHHLTRHILGLFHGCPGARAWRRLLSTEGPKPGTGADILLEALSRVPEDTACPPPGEPAKREQ